MIVSERMRRVDAAWLHMDRPENPADIVSMFTFDEAIDPARVHQIVSERLLTHHPRFRQRIAEASLGAAPLWEWHEGFDVARHFFRRELPLGDREALARLLGEISSKPLDPTLPLWRVTVANAGRRSAVITKLHHCMGDGFALVSLFLALSDEGAAEPPLPRRQHTFRDLRTLRAPAALLAALRDPARALAVAREAVDVGRSLTRMTLLPNGASAVLARRLSGVRRIAWTRPIKLERLQAAAHATGATVNELLMAALSGALRDVLAAAGEPVDGITLRALVPVNMRDDRSAAVRALGNHFGLVFLDMPVGLTSPAARLQAVRENAATVRGSPDTLVAFAVLGALGLMPRALEKLGADFFSRKASLVVTNVAGPQQPLHFLGHAVDRMLFWVPHPGKLGLGVSLMSYAGSVTIGVRADVAVLPDPAALARGVEEQIDVYAPRPARRPHVSTAERVESAPIA